MTTGLMKPTKKKLMKLINIIKLLIKPEGCAGATFFRNIGMNVKTEYTKKK